MATASSLQALTLDLLVCVANRLDSSDKAAFRASCINLRDAAFVSTTALTWRMKFAYPYINALSDEGMIMLGKCPHLRKLVIESMRVADLAPLSALTGLKSLDCPACMGDLDPLAALTQLQSLCIDLARAADLSPLAALTGLQHLRYLQQGVGSGPACGPWRTAAHQLQRHPRVRPRPACSPNAATEL